MVPVKLLALRYLRTTVNQIQGGGGNSRYLSDETRLYKMIKTMIKPLLRKNMVSTPCQ